MQWLFDKKFEVIDELWKKVVEHGFKICQLPHSVPMGMMEPCKVSNYRPDSRGSIQVCTGGHDNKKHIMVHALSYVKHKRQKIDPAGKLQVSHLCNNHSCSEPSHLVLETALANHSRKNCIGFIWSGKHSDWVPVCEHDPPCLTFKKRKVDVNEV